MPSVNIYSRRVENWSLFTGILAIILLNNFAYRSHLVEMLDVNDHDLDQALTSIILSPYYNIYFQFALSLYLLSRSITLATVLYRQSHLGREVSTDILEQEARWYVTFFDTPQ